MGLLALVVVSGGYLGVVAIRREAVRQLPAPVGIHPVGRVELALTTAGVDPTRSPPGPRTDSVWLWYPATTSARRTPASYAPGRWDRLHVSGPAGYGQGSFRKLHTHAVEGEPIAHGQFGLVVLEPGMGFSGPQYQAIAESVASAGFVVAAVTPSHSANVSVVNGTFVGSTPAGNPSDLGGHDGTPAAEADRLVQLWAHDATAVAAQLHAGTAVPLLDDHLRAGTLYVGHSFGGAAALQACAGDPGCRGAADLDGTQFGPVLHTGVQHPIMLLGSQDSCITGTCGPQAARNGDDLSAARSLLRHSHTTSTCLILAGARHFNFSDYGTYYLAAPLKTLLPLAASMATGHLRPLPP